MDRDDFLRGYINNFGKGVGFRSEQEFVKDFLESMDPDNPDVYLPSNKEEYIPIRNKAFDQTIGKGFADAYDRYKVIGSGAFGTAFQDPDNPNKVFKAQLLNDKENIERAEREVEAQIKAAQMGRAPMVDAVETFPLRKAGEGQAAMDLLRSFDTTGRFSDPTIHVTEMDKVETLDKQGYLNEPGGVLDRFVEKGLIDANDDPPIYKLNASPEIAKEFNKRGFSDAGQMRRTVEREADLAFAQGNLDLADAGIVHNDLKDSGSELLRDDHITYNPNTKKMQFIDYGVAKIHDHANDLHEHTKNLNLKDETLKNKGATERAQHFLEHKLSHIMDGFKAIGHEDIGKRVQKNFYELAENDNLLGMNDLINDTRELVGEFTPEDANIRLVKGQKTGYIYGKDQAPTMNQIMTDVRADEFPQFADKSLEYDPLTPAPKEDKKLLEFRKQQDIKNALNFRPKNKPGTSTAQAQYDEFKKRFETKLTDMDDY